MSDISHLDPDESIKPLEEDNAPPFSQPDESVDEGTSEHIDPTHPVFDSGEDIDSSEVYSEGLANAADVSEPHGGGVTSYDPAKDSRIHPEIEEQN